MLESSLSIFQGSSNMKNRVQQSLAPGLMFKKERSRSKEKEGIHSGHFMVSRVHDNKTGDYLSDEEDDVPPAGFNFSEASQDTCQTYKFGPRSTQTLVLDASLSTLFEHLTLAYSGKLTSPKWKQFRGMHMNVKEKIRLNNIIWREWHMQYIFGRKTKVCQFATPLQDVGHSRAEAVVLEGYYWKRRLDTIAKEYKMWRKFFTHKRFKHDLDDLENAMDESSHDELLERVGTIHNLSGIPKHQMTSNTDLLINTRDIQEMMELSDSLFSTLKQPFDFPNPRELSGFGYGDYIQPGLLQFQPNLAVDQPNLEDFMDLDPCISEYWANSRAASTSQASITDSNQAGPSLRMPAMDVDMGSSSMVPSPQIVMSPQTPPTPAYDSPVATPSPGQSGDTTQMLVDTDNFILNQLQLIQQQNQQKQIEQQKRQHQEQRKQQQLQQQKQQQQIQEQKRLQQQLEQERLQKSQQELLNQLLQNSQLKNLILNSGNAVNIIEELLKGVQNQQAPPPTLTPAPPQPPPPQQSSPVSPPSASHTTLLGLINSSSSSTATHSHLATNQKSVNNSVTKPKPHPKIGTKSILEALNADENQCARNKLTLSQRTQTTSQIPKKPVVSPMRGVVKDQAGFTIPPLPAAVAKTRVMKQRPLAPTPTTTQSSISQQNSYLAQLLTTGTYPGAIINVKDEGRGNTGSPNQTAVHTLSNNQSPSMTLPISITDFPTSVLIAAASHAFSPSHISVKDVFQTVSKQVTSSSCTASMVSSPAKREVPSPSPVYSPPSPASADSSSTSVSTFDDSMLSLKSPEASTYSDITDEKDRTALHLSAEKKRRNNIKTPGQLQKSGFELLLTLIPSLRQNPNAKVSKAAMLQKTAEYCKKLKSERAQMKNEADILRQEINSLNQSISICQSQLPATGVPVTRQRADQMREMFEEYVKQRTLTNWKFWIFSLIIRSLFESYNTMVSTASVDELCRTVLAWLDQHCSLPSLRPIVSDAMRHLSTTTSILSDPARVPEQAAQAVIKRQKHQSGDGGT